MATAAARRTAGTGPDAERLRRFLDGEHREIRERVREILSRPEFAPPRRVPHGVTLDGADLFFRHVRLLGGPAPVRQYLPELIDRVFAGRINPGKVFDLVLPLDQVAEGYRAMDERRAIKTLLRP